MPETLSPLRDLPLEETRVASGRIGRIFLAYALACLAAAIVRTLGLVIEESVVRGFGRLVADNGAASLAIVPLMTTLIVFVAAAPFATAFLVWSEGRALRSAGLHVIAGAIVGLATQALLAVLPFAGADTSPGLWLLAAAAGAAGGFVHWTVAVRSAPPPPRRA